MWSNRIEHNHMFHSYLQTKALKNGLVNANPSPTSPAFPARKTSPPPAKRVEKKNTKMMKSSKTSCDRYYIVYSLIYGLYNLAVK